MADNKQILPAITGNAMADTAIRYAAATIGAGAVGIGAGWAKAHGYHVPNSDALALYGQIAGGLVILVAACIMGLRATRNSEAAVVANAIQSAATGLIPQAIARKATPEQQTTIQQSAATVTDIKPATVK